MSFKNQVQKLIFEACSGERLVLLSEPESKKGNSSDLNDLESDTWQITNGMTGSTESRDEHFIVLVTETHTTISWNVGSDSLVVLLELDSDTLSDGRVWLLSFDGNFFNNDSSSVGGSHEWFFIFSS